MVQHLLNPSLAEAKARSLYSTGALFAAAFFGGAVSVVVLAAINSRILGRLRKDAIVLFGVVVAVSAALGLSRRYLPDPDSGDLRLLARGLGLVAWIAMYALHRKAYKAMSTTGIEPLSPWRMTIASIVIGLAANAAILLAGGGAGGAVR